MLDQKFNPEFGTYTNLLLTLTVAAFGVYWLFRPKRQVPFRRLAFRYWWCSWLSWVIVWSLLPFRNNPSVGSPLTVEILVLIFDNLNTIFLIGVYFVLTRGEGLKTKQAAFLTSLITLSLAALFGVFYLAFGVFSNQLTFAYDIHRTCTLCLSVLTPILVGWAFNLRFKNSHALKIGALYGFIQPIIYATELRGMEERVFETFDMNICLEAFKASPLCGEINSLKERQQWVLFIRPAVSMAVGLLKVVWAITCTRLLSDVHATGENLIKVDRSKQRDTEWRPSVSAQAAVLAGMYILITIMFVVPLTKDEYIQRFSAAVGMITSVYGLWLIIWQVWKKTRGL